MFFPRNMVIDIGTKGLNKSDICGAFSLSLIRYDKLLFALLLTTSWFISTSNSFQQYQSHNVKQHSYGGQFVAEEEAEAISIEANVRLAKIPCNFTTKTNCIYVEQEKFSSASQRNQRNTNEVVVSWVPFAAKINSTRKTFATNINKRTASKANSNVREKHQNDFYNFNWIFELLVCMMLASAFEICLLVLRNLRSISVAFFAFWSALNASLQKLCCTCSEPATSSSNKNDQQRLRNVPMGEKRTLSYIFAILTWRASQTAKDGSHAVQEGFADEASQHAISYGHFTTMGDLLLLILFTHVYYQRQRFHQGDENEANPDTEQVMECHKEKNKNGAMYQKFYDKQNNSHSDNVLNEQTFQKRTSSNNRCSYFCGNMYQQISSSLEERKPDQAKLTTLSTCTTKTPYLTYCTCFVWYTCCFCQYSCRFCCYCYSNCRRWNQRCHINIPLCNSVYCCCLFKSLKSFQDVSYQYCCYLCCFQDACYISGNSSSHITYRCYCHHMYCRFCNAKTSQAPAKTINLLLLNNAKTSAPTTCSTSSADDYCLWKFIWNENSYSLFYEEGDQSFLVFHVKDIKTIFMNKRSYYQFAVDVFNTLLPQYFLNMKNCQTLLKWKKLHVTVVVMALIFICASSGGADHSHHQYYSSLINRCNKHFYRCRQSKRRRRRRRRRHQHCKAYRPQHYFYATLIQCVKRQKTKKLHKKFVNKLHKNSAKLLISTLANFENSLSPTAMQTKAQMVRSVKRVRGSKPNIVWLLIGLIWFEGPKIVNCNVIINYQNQQQQQQQHEQQQQAANMPKETTANSINLNFEHKVENFNPIKTKNNNSNNNNNYKNKVNNINNNSIIVNNNYNYNSSNNNSRRHSNSTISSHKGSTNKNTNSSNSSNIHLSVNLIPIINTIHFKHYCNSNYHQKLIRSSQRVQRALKTNPNWKTSITSSASPNNNNVNDDLDSEPMPSPVLQTLTEVSHAQSDLMRLESIKHQILFKLGLTRKPNVSHPLPKQFIWDTIYRADGIKSFHDFSNTNNFPDHHHFPPQQNYPSWPKTSHRITNAVPISHYPQRQQRDDRSAVSEDSVENIKRSIGSLNVVRKKFRLNKQPLQQRQANLHNQYNSNDMLYRKTATATTSASASKTFNQFLYATTNRNKSILQSNATVKDFTILKQSNKHQQFHKNSPHSTTITTQQQQQQQQNLRQHELNQHTNNNNNNNNNNKNYRNNNNSNNINNSNNVNDSNNNNSNKNYNRNIKSNNNNNIIMVQKHLRNNNKHIEGATKFTYLTDINSSDDSSNNNMKEYHNTDDPDDNNTALRKKNHQHHIHDHNHERDRDRIHLKPLQLQQQHGDGDVMNERTTENFQHFNIEGFVDVPGDVGVTVLGNADVDTEVIQDEDDDDEIGSINDDDDNDNNDDSDDDQYYQHNHQQHQHDKYFPKSEPFDESEDFFGSTQEIITFAEKGKIYKNHRLVEFSHQNNENPKQKLHVRNAEIHIRIGKISLKNRSRAGSGIKRKKLKIWIFQLVENNYTYKGFDHVAKFCASFEVDTSRLGWKKFDITSTVKEWYSRREGEKLRLLIDCTGCGKLYSVHLFNDNNNKGDVTIRERRIADERHNANANDISHKHFYNISHSNDKFNNFLYNRTFAATEKAKNDRKNSLADKSSDDDVLNSSRPFLVLHTETKRQRRVRRRAINCNGALHGQCCKESFYVSFKALGWDDWIIAPRGYFANYCRGDCTGPYRTPDTFQTFHAHFIEEYRKMGLLNGMQPCCAPIKFSSMSLIYYGDEGIIKRDLPKMVVDECGCP